MIVRVTTTGAARRRTRGQVVTAALLLLAALTAALVAPGIHSSGQVAEVGVLELGADDRPPGATAFGAVTEDVNGYRVLARGRATVTVPLELPAPGDGRALLRLWAYGPAGVDTTVALIAADGSERLLGRPELWVGQTLDVTREARAGTARLRATSANGSTESQLFLDRIAPVAAARSAIATAAPWAVGALVLLVAAALLAATGRARAHWPLAALLGGGAVLLWSEIPSKSLEPLDSDPAETWDAAISASWSGFHDGLLWGSWERVSSLGVQFFHAVTPIVGTAPVAARSASLLAGLLALAAIYAAGNRAAGLKGALVASGLALTCAPFRDAIAGGSALPVLVLASALFVYCLHACLAGATTPAIVLLGGAAALLALAEPTWLPGALAVVAIVALTYGEPDRRRRVLWIGALTTIVLVAPHLASTADQHDGSLFADMSARATAARNLEFAGAGHGAPTPLELARDPLGGTPVTLPEYLLGDHSPSQLGGGTLAGAQAFLADVGDAYVVGAIALLAGLAGVAYVLLLPRHRLLVLLPPIVALPTLFIAARTEAGSFAAGVPIWPAMLVCAAILAYGIARLARPHTARMTAAIRHMLATVTARW